MLGYVEILQCVLQNFDNHISDTRVTSNKRANLPEVLRFCGYILTFLCAATEYHAPFLQIF
jgi:hypothetical protein